MNRFLFNTVIFLACATLSPAQDTKEWQLVWSDEFDGDGPYNAETWEPEQGFVRNHEDQWYQGENAFRQNGCLIIECRKTDLPNPLFRPEGQEGRSRQRDSWRSQRECISYTSSSLTTRRSFSFLYGRMEVRARIPVAGGAWPAIWLLGSAGEDRLTWPSCGEIDVMEYYRINGVPHILANAAWGDDQNRAMWNTKRIPFTHFTDRDPQWADQFHTWRMDWTPEYIRIYLDDELLNDIPLSTTINGEAGRHINPFTRPQYILLNLALGGDNGGTIDDTAMPLRYEIDYVRVYQNSHEKTTAKVAAQEFNTFIPVDEGQEQMSAGQFEPTWESLSKYETPEWFRDAKFGIWAHWGPQCVEGSGDWMARNMYHEGSREYTFHRDHYGHQSEVGFKDILPLFRAERWQPDSLVAYYKKVGARYFFALGNHHDNFDLWDSKYQPWNSKRIGPKRDILAEWAAAAEKAGLPLGISFHADHAWRWYEPAQKCDTTGDKKGIPYDGKLTREDGRGKWWEGLDPQDLYAQRHPLSTGSIHDQWDWTHGAVLPTQQFITNFYNRTLDAINRYHPSLIYFDVTVLPFYGLSDCGLRIAAHEYNVGSNGKGKTDNVVFGKILQEYQRKALTWDVERGAPNAIQPEPWQTCTCLGGWHWNDDISRRNRYKTAPQVVKFLADVVSKNGNLLLSVPLRADGTFDEHEHAILEGIRAWMDQNSEAIYKTRPWVRFGEGPLAESDIKINAQGFNEGSYSRMGSEEIRFTQTAKALYAIVMGWPENHQVVIRSLSKGSPDFAKRVKRVDLLGYGRVKARQTADGLLVTLPEKPVNDIAPVLRIRK